MKGALLSIKDGFKKSINDFLINGLEKRNFDYILMPVKVPAGDSFAYVLFNDKTLFEKANPLAPVMPVQGAKALSNVTRHLGWKDNIVALMRSCEVRAVTELFKLNQVDLDNVTLVSIDCPGVLPLSDYLDNQEESEQIFKKNLESWKYESVRPVCKVCQKFSTSESDLHIGLLGTDKENVFLIPRTDKGKELLDKCQLDCTSELTSWEQKVKEITNQKEQVKKTAFKELSEKIKGADKLLDVFSQCINCHNCMRVCPICICRQCYFNSEALQMPVDNYTMRAERKGALRFPPDVLLFHLGRMSHMSLSCVSCGQCEDVCPVSIPVAQVFSLVAEDTQKTFDYVAGRDKEEKLPISSFEVDELKSVEQPYVKTYVKKEVTHA